MATTKKTTKKSTVTKTKSRKRSKKPLWLSVLILVIGGLYAGWYFYNNPDEFLSIVFAQESEETELSADGTTKTTAKAKSSKSKKSKKSKKNKNLNKTTKETVTGFSFEGDLGYTEDNPLYLGNPSDAVAQISENANYLMEKDQYTVSYNSKLLIPNWVAWHLDSSDLGDADRSDDFRPDDDLPKDWYKVKKADYQYSEYGYDRGHVCPSADRTATLDDNSMTFLMTNMVPQTPDNNRVIWMHFENFERELVNQGNEVYIIAGPYGKGGTSAMGKFNEIPITTSDGAVLKMRVPSYTWKVLIAIPEGEGDLSRIDKSATVIAINVPNKMGIAEKGDWEQYLCSVDDIEKLTGYDFFELLPDEVETTLESSVYVKK